jgi:hypothetical protein
MLHEFRHGLGEHQATEGSWMFRTALARSQESGLVENVELGIFQL